MEQITLGQIGLAVTFLVGLISGFGYLHSHIKKWITNTFKEEFTPINKKVDALQEQINTVDIEGCKNYLVSFLSNVERGMKPDDIEIERFWEEYEHYKKKGGNSYIERKVEQLKADGKL